MSYFEKTKNTDGQVKILVAIVIVLILLNVVAFKMVANIAENKTIQINVPSYLDDGKYVIGSDESTKNVYMMWGRVWFDQISNFSYKNVEERLKFIEPFLSRKTMFESKAQLDSLVRNVKENFITQTFEIKDYSVERLKKGYVEIKATGQLHRKVGLRQDELSGIDFGYSIIAYTKHGNVLIKSIKSFVDNTNDSKTRKLLKDNQYIDFEKFLSDEDAILLEKQKEHKKKIQESGGMG